ncbi:tubulin polyglutamylase ttll6 isoform X3 [Hydra vulgaris]|uniref:tubulin polyglutamylase ttll6 isoform X3 n=1 Tax=Hydra vulgaris TaxID=6087 RepID=UPI001F5FD603|nr:tubulin polyglutamylase ttll6 isoform X3 [Hydra vulgaris]
MSSQDLLTKSLNNDQDYSHHFLNDAAAGDNNIYYRVFSKISLNKSVSNDDQNFGDHSSTSTKDSLKNNSKINSQENLSFNEICLHTSKNIFQKDSVINVNDKCDFKKENVLVKQSHRFLKCPKKKDKRKKRILKINLTNCKYECVRRAAKKFGFQEVEDTDDWTLLWTDCSVSFEKVFNMKKYQNFKPESNLICQQYLSRPFLIDGFKFDLRIYVVVTSCDPLRIFVYKDGLARFATVKYAYPAKNNLNNVFMHLTNYAIQKNSVGYCRDNETGSKRKLSTINRWFQENGYDVKKIWKNIDDIIIKTLITAHPVLKHNYLTCFPNVKGSACFEILGFDVILDRNLKPWILEVNHSPSFTTDSKLDREIKDAVVYDTLVLANFSLNDKRKCLEDERKQLHERLVKSKDRKKDVKDIEESREMEDYLKNLTKYEDEHIGGFRRLYPENNEEEYRLFFENSCSLFQQTAASKARAECARLQREEISTKKKFIIKNSKRLTNFSDSKIDLVKRRLSRTTVSVIKKTKGSITLLNSSEPCPINKYDEQERLGNLLRRENLLKSFGLPKTVKTLLESVEHLKSLGGVKNAVQKETQKQLSEKDVMKVTENDDVLSYNHWPSNYLLQRSLHKNKYLPSDINNSFGMFSISKLSKMTSEQVGSSNLKHSPFTNHNSNLKHSPLTNHNSSNLGVGTNRDLNYKSISCSTITLSNLEQGKCYPKIEQSYSKRLSFENNSLCNGLPGLRISSSSPAQIKYRTNTVMQNAIDSQLLNQSPYTQRVQNACNNIRIKQIQLLKRNASSRILERRVSSTN